MSSLYDPKTGVEIRTVGELRNFVASLPFDLPASTPIVIDRHEKDKPYGFVQGVDVSLEGMEEKSDFYNKETDRPYVYERVDFTEFVKKENAPLVLVIK